VDISSLPIYEPFVGNFNWLIEYKVLAVFLGFVEGQIGYKIIIDEYLREKRSRIYSCFFRSEKHFN
jgi:hypothetical protein